MSEDSMNVVVLGCGLVGKAIVRDLVENTDHRLTVVDNNEAALAEATKGFDVRTGYRAVSSYDQICQRRRNAVG